MDTREIYIRKSTLLPKPFIESIFATEFVNPSRNLWIVSPWVTDLDILDNVARRFSILDPDWPSSPVQLSKIIEGLLTKGTIIHFVVNTDDHNKALILKLNQLRIEYPDHLHVKIDQLLHEKGIVSDNFLLDGSMNLTFNGFNINTEFIRYSCNKESIAQKKIAFQENYGD